MPIIKENYHSLNVIQKRSGTNSTFSTETKHTSAFNTVHIIAAVIGVIGAIIVTVTIFLFCKKRKKAKPTVTETTTVTRTDMTSMPTTTANKAQGNRFGQFATDFDNHVEPPKPNVVHVEDISPMMQQYQLQLKLLSQEISSTSSPTTSSSSSNPPPPYRP